MTTGREKPSGGGLLLLLGPPGLPSGSSLGSLELPNETYFKVMKVMFWWFLDVPLIRRCNNRQLAIGFRVRCLTCPWKSELL